MRLSLPYTFWAVTLIVVVYGIWTWGLHAPRYHLLALETESFLGVREKRLYRFDHVTGHVQAWVSAADTQGPEAYWADLSECIFMRGPDGQRTNTPSPRFGEYRMVPPLRLPWRSEAAAKPRQRVKVLALPKKPPAHENQVSPP